MTATELPYVEAELNYLKPMAERPRYYAYEAAPGEFRSNMTADPHQVRIHDMRPIASEIELDRQGFALVEQKTAVHDFWDDDEVRRVYYPEAERFLAEVTGASRVFIFDHLQPAACRACRTARPADRASRRPGFMSTTPRARGRSGSATCCPTKPRSY